MGYASQAGRARTNAKNPEAHGICDRCGFRYNFNDLQWQFDWRGAKLQNLRILVCDICLDEPQENLRAIVLPADPVPIINARPELYAQDSTDYYGTGTTTTAYPSGIPVISNEVLGGATTDDTIIPQPIGPNSRPNQFGQLNPSVIGADPNAQMTPVMDVQWARRIPITSIVANGTPTISINCSAVHGLTTGQQTAIWGTSNSLVYGIFTITVTTATVFTVQVNANVLSGNVATPTTIVQTVNVGLPWSVTQVPQTGV